MKILTFSMQNNWLLKHSYRDIIIKVIPIKNPPGLAMWKILIKCIISNLIAIPNVNEYDAIFSPSLSNCIMFSIFRILFGRHIIRPPIVTIDIALPRLVKNSIIKRILIRILNEIDVIICFSNHFRIYFEKELKYIGKTVFIPFGIDENKFRSKINTSEYFLLTAGRGGRDYNTFLAAINSIKVNTIIVSGKDTIARKDESNNLTNITNKNITVLWNLPQNELINLIEKALIIILPLQDLPYPVGQMVLLESMGMGKPIIVTKVSGTIDYITDGVDAIFVNPNDVLDLKEKIQFLIDHEETRKELGKNARRSIEQKYNERIMANNIIKYLKTIYPNTE